MGDVLGLIERAEETVERAEAEALARKLRRSEFTLEDYRDQLQQLRKLGPLDQVLAMLPGHGRAQGRRRRARRARDAADARHHRLDDARRSAPTRALINGSRRKRIAKGSGSTVEDVNRLLKQFAQARKLMKGLGSGSAAMKRLAARMPQFR